MRGYLLLAIVIVIMFFAIFKPKIGLLGYVWFSLMRPDILAYSSGRYPLSQMLAIATLVGSLQALPRAERLFRTPFTILLGIFTFLITISTVFAVNPDLSYPYYWQLMRALLMSLLIVLFIDTVEDLRLLLLVMAFSLGIFGMKFGAYAVLRGGARLSSIGIGGLMGENNGLALGLVMALPLIWYSRLTVVNRNVRMFMILMGGLTMMTIIQTFSRGAALALAATIVIIPWRSKYRVGAFLSIALFVAPAYYLVQESYSSRIASILDPEKESSANSRLLQIDEALGIWEMRPWFGVGFGGRNYMALSQVIYKKDVPLMIHNTYLEMLANCGLFTFIVYVIMLFSAIFWLGRSARRMRRLKNGLEIYPWAIQAALIAFAIDSTFHPRSLFDFFYMLLMTTAAWHCIEREHVLKPAAIAANAAVPGRFGQPAAAVQWAGRRAAWSTAGAAENPKGMQIVPPGQY